MASASPALQSPGAPREIVSGWFFALGADYKLLFFWRSLFSNLRSNPSLWASVFALLPLPSLSSHTVSYRLSFLSFLPIYFAIFSLWLSASTQFVNFIIAFLFSMNNIIIANLPSPSSLSAYSFLCLSDFVSVILSPLHSLSPLFIKQHLSKPLLCAKFTPTIHSFRARGMNESSVKILFNRGLYAHGNAFVSTETIWSKKERAESND